MKKELLTFEESNYYYPPDAINPQMMPDIQHLHHFNGIDESFFQIQGKHQPHFHLDTYIWREN